MADPALGLFPQFSQLPVQYNPQMFAPGYDALRWLGQRPGMMQQMQESQMSQALGQALSFEKMMMGQQQGQMPPNLTLFEDPTAIMKRLFSSGGWVRE